MYVVHRPNFTFSSSLAPSSTDGNSVGFLFLSCHVVFIFSPFVVEENGTGTVVPTKSPRCVMISRILTGCTLGELCADESVSTHNAFSL